eukprot:COSAG06_NODE_521_length_14727_cov_19.202283_7_plen_204_part_00
MTGNGRPTVHSFSRFCSFIGSLSRSRCGRAPHLPPHPRLFSMMVKTGSEVCKVSAEVCEVSVVMAAEERHKSPSKLGRAGEERQKVPLGVALGVCSIGSESPTPPVTLVKVPWKGAFSLAEAERAELELLGLHSWSLNAFRVFRQITPQSPTQHITACAHSIGHTHARLTVIAPSRLQHYRHVFLATARPFVHAPARSAGTRW